MKGKIIGAGLRIRPGTDFKDPKPAAGVLMSYAQPVLEMDFRHKKIKEFINKSK